MASTTLLKQRNMLRNSVVVILLAHYAVSSSSSLATTTSTQSASKSSPPAVVVQPKKNTRHNNNNNNVILSSGLQNLGNTCYLNAQLQCAFHIPAVRQLIVNKKNHQNLDPPAEQQPEEDKESREPQAAESLALQALRRTFAEMEEYSSSSSTSSGGNRPLAPRILCAALGIPVMVQQDSQEFWKLLLPALQLPALTDLYQGAYEDFIVALDGSGRERRREEAFLDLSLDVTAGSVDSALKELFGAPEVLRCSEGNGWRPEKGADKVDAHKGTLLRSQGLSSILQLHLKRFQFDWSTETTSKINSQFTFPVVLDLSLVCEDTKNDAKSLEDDRVIYDLQAVLVHAGEYGSGHYYAYVRPNVEKDEWYRFNDHIVEQVKLKDVLCDAFGGKCQLDDISGETNDNKNSGGCFLVRLRRAFLPRGASYGHGGAKSNAYVLQYVRRSDIPKLYRGNGE